MNDPDNDFRRLFDRALDGEPDNPVHPEVDLARGRTALRRRRVGVAAGAVCGIAMVAVGLAYVPNLVDTASDPGFAGGGNAVATPTAAPTAAPTDQPSSTPSSAPPSDEPTTGSTPSNNPCARIPTPSATKAPEDGEPAGKEIACGPPRASFADVLEEHLGTEHFESRGVSSGGGREAAWDIWTVGEAEGTVVTTVLRGEYADEWTGEWIDDGRDGRPCAARPVKTGHDPAFAWTSCSSERLADGSTLRIAEGEDAYAPARAATLITRDGTIVSIATSTAYFERNAGDSEASYPDFPAKLAELPLSAVQLKAVVTDPRMLDAG